MSLMSDLTEVIITDVEILGRELGFQSPATRKSFGQEDRPGGS